MSLWDSISDTITNAWTGNLSQHQRDVMVAQGQADIAKASAGAAPAVIAERQKQIANEIDGFLLATDQGPQGTGQGAGLRIPGLGVVGTAGFFDSLDKLRKFATIVFVIGLVFLGARSLGLLKPGALRRIKGEK
jgi:hypothetical protein